MSCRNENAKLTQTEIVEFLTEKVDLHFDSFLDEMRDLICREYDEFLNEAKPPISPIHAKMIKKIKDDLLTDIFLDYTLSNTSR